LDSFGGNGPFQRVTAEKKEKFSPLQRFDAICLKRMPLIGLSPNVPSVGLDPTSEKRIARVRISVKKMQRKNLAAFSAGARPAVSRPAGSPAIGRRRAAKAEPPLTPEQLVDARFGAGLGIDSGRRFNWERHSSSRQKRLPLARKPTFDNSHPLRWCGKTCARWSAPDDMRKLRGSTAEELITSAARPSPRAWSPDRTA
jgi:hypothetical protein